MSEAAHSSRRGGLLRVHYRIYDWVIKWAAHRHAAWALFLIAVAEASFIVDGSMRPRRATVSIGVAQYEDDRKNFFKAADDALYRAKDAGKNCVVCAESNPDTGSNRS